MKFIDKTELKVIAGKGGAGMCSFKAAFNMPKLGPDGGNGGLGGDVLLEGNEGLNTLSSLRFRAEYKAEDGGRGGSNGKTGRCGEHLLIKVPLGTIAYDQATGEKLGEILNHGQTLRVVKGGKRGYGNLHLVSATNRAPNYATPGEEGEIKDISLELKVLADIGLAGFPNAGKSTLLTRISAARPKVADYPFTTLTPNLGVVHMGERGDFDFVVADIPGLIEGASEGKGLGHEFLRHLERTKVILYMIDAAETFGLDFVAQFEKLKVELRNFSLDLADKPYMVLLNKMDIAQDQEKIEALKKHLKGTKLMFGSAISGDGISEVIRSMYALLAELKNEEKGSDH